VSSTIRNVVLDTTVIVNFLVLGRADLFAHFDGTAFWVSQEVLGEVADFQDVTLLVQLDQLMQDKVFHRVEHYEMEELRLFGELRDPRVLGDGECAAISLAIHRGWILATDDKPAGRELLRRLPDESKRMTTASLLIELIQSQHLSIADADAMKERLARDYRFRMKFHSFADLLPEL
jgi:predicted nucleic acid-binding protein